jgi:hypothetical protein
VSRSLVLAGKRAAAELGYLLRCRLLVGP